MNKTIKLEHRELIVKKLPLGKYAELLKALEKLPLQFNSLSGLKNEQLIPKIPALIGECFPDIVRLFTIATDLTQEECENTIGLSEATDVFMAIIEVNNYRDIFAKIKKNFGSQITKAKATGTGGL
jgi:hypothetical protein